MADNHTAYAEALFALAAESGTLDDTSAALENVLRIIDEQPAYMELLAAPSIPVQQREEALFRAFGDSLPAHVVSFLQLLCRRGDIRELTACAGEFDRLYRNAQRVSVAKVVSAAPLAAEQQAQLRDKLEKSCGHRVETEYTLDPALIGGVVVHIDGKVLDGSLRRRLHDLKEVIDQ